MKLSLAICALVASCAAAPATALTAQVGMCLPEVAAPLAIFTAWGERATVLGKIDSFRSFTIYVNPDTGTYTMMGNDGHGVSCIVASGWNLQLIPLPANT